MADIWKEYEVGNKENEDAFSKYEVKPPTLTDDFLSGFRQIYTGLKAGSSSFYDFLDKGADLISKATGLEKGGLFKNLAQNLKPSDAELSEGGLIGKINQAIGGTIPTLTKYALGTTTLGPVGGFAATEAIERSPQGLLEATKGAVKGAAMGSILKAVEPLSKMLRVPIMGGVFGGQSALEGGNPQDVITSALTGGAFGLMGGPGKSIKEIRKGTPQETLAPGESIIPEPIPEVKPVQSMPVESVPMPKAEPMAKATPSEPRYFGEIRELRDLVIRGEPGKRIPIEGQSSNEWTGYGSSYPGFMRNKGWTKNEVLVAINKGLNGVKLGVRQQEIWDAAKEEAKGMFAERVRLAQAEKIQPIATGDLEVGDKVKVRGEVLKVTEKTPEEIVIKDGQELRLDPYFDTIKGKRITQPVLSPTASSQYLLPGVKQGLTFPTEGKAVTPTLEGTPLGEAARKAALERFQPTLGFSKPDLPPTSEPKGVPRPSQPPTPPSYKDIGELLKETPAKVGRPTFFPESIHSPYYVLDKDPFGAGKKISQTLYQADLAKGKFTSDFYKEFKQNVPIEPNSPSSLKVGEYLDRYQSWDEIPIFDQMKFSPQEKQAFLYMRNKWNEWADLLESKGLLLPDRRVKSYLFRIFDKTEVYQGWKNERDQARAMLSVGGIDAKVTATLKDRLNKLDKSIETYEKTGTIIYDYLPKELSAPFLKEREGTTGYSLDSVKAMPLYEYYLARKLYDEPAIRQSVELMQNMHPEFKNFTVQHLRDFAGLNKPDRINRWARVVTTLEYAKDMGFSVRSAIVNSTQQLNTITEIGPIWTARGAAKALTPEGQALWEASGHAKDVEGLYYGMVSKGLNEVQKASAYLFNKVETANRKIAYLGAYEKGISKGMSRDQAITFADQIVRRTQFSYGRIGMPHLIHAPAGPIVLQFSSFPIKQLELFSTWAKEDPKKLVSYLILATGLGEGLRELGADMNNALGIGVDIRELGRALISLGNMQPSAALIHARLALPQAWGGIAGSGVFPSGLAPAISSAKNILQGEWEKLIPVQIGRTVQAVRAFMEGTVQTPMGSQGLPVRTITGKELKYTETPWEVAQRTLLARPTRESEAQRISQTERMFDDLRRKKTVEAAKAFLSGNEKKAGQIIEEFGLNGDTVAHGIESEIMKQTFTAQERQQLKGFVNKGRMATKIKLGEGPKPGETSFSTPTNETLLP